MRHSFIGRKHETFLYAIMPINQQQSLEPHKKKVVALYYADGWTNTELTKDCGFIPFLLQKNHNCDSLPTGSQSEKIKYRLNNGKNIDCLLLRGAYYTNVDVAVTYKKVNPNGRSYVGLEVQRVSKNNGMLICYFGNDLLLGDITKLALRYKSNMLYQIKIRF